VFFRDKPLLGLMPEIESSMDLYKFAFMIAVG